MRAGRYWPRAVTGSRVRRGDHLGPISVEPCTQSHLYKWEKSRQPDLDYVQCFSFLDWWFSLSFYVFFLENQEFPSEPWFSVRNSATIRCHTVQGRVWGNLAKRLRAGSQGFSVRRCWEVGRWCCLFLMGKWTCRNMFNKNVYNVCLDGNVVSLARTFVLWVIQTLDIFQWETRHHSTPCSEDGWRSKDLQIGWRSEPWFVFVQHCLYLFLNLS